MIHEFQNAAVDCPEWDMLRRFVSGEFDESQAEFLESHLLQCPECETLLDRLDDPSDAVIQALATLPTTAEDELAYQQVREAALAQSVVFEDRAKAHAHLRNLDRLADPALGPLPHRLGNYELLACIGRGASGAVYRSRHLKLDQTVAVKVLDPSRTLDANAFLREMKTIGSLAHDHIIRATDAGEADGYHYLVMEYVEGIDAARLLFRGGPLPVADACEIVRQAALGLQFVHERSLLHRDVKPSNLLVTIDGQVKLLDLGIATRTDEHSCEGKADTEEKPRGTFDYMAPELWTEPSSADVPADIYSLGCTLYKLIAGTPVQRAATFGDDFFPNAPRSLRRLLLSALAARPEDRPPSAKVVADALGAHSRGANLITLVQSAIPSAVVSNRANSSPRWWDATSISRRTAVAALATTGASALLWSKLGLGNAPQLRKTEWRPLTPVAPELLLMPKDSEQVKVVHSETGEISVASEELALLHLGRPVTGMFTLAVNLLRTDSQSRGLFFRGHTDYSKEPHTLQFQSVELIPTSESVSDEITLTAKQPETGHSHILLWSQWQAQRIDGRLEAQRTSLAEVAVELQQRSQGQTLQVTCGRQGMPEVLWNGQPLHETMWQLALEARKLQRLSAAQLPTAYLGRLGLLNDAGSSEFLQPRLAYL